MCARRATAAQAPAPAGDSRRGQPVSGRKTSCPYPGSGKPPKSRGPSFSQRMACSVDAWPPDVTRDGKVDYGDLFQFFIVAKSHTYSRRLDLNANGVVDIIDLVMVGAFFNRRCNG